MFYDKHTQYLPQQCNTSNKLILNILSAPKLFSCSEIKHEEISEFKHFPLENFFCQIFLTKLHCDGKISIQFRQCFMWKATDGLLRYSQHFQLVACFFEILFLVFFAFSSLLLVKFDSKSPNIGGSHFHKIIVDIKDEIFEARTMYLCNYSP